MRAVVVQWQANVFWKTWLSGPFPPEPVPTNLRSKGDPELSVGPTRLMIVVWGPGDESCTRRLPRLKLSVVPKSWQVLPVWLRVMRIAAMLVRVCEGIEGGTTRWWRAVLRARSRCVGGAGARKVVEQRELGICSGVGNPGYQPGTFAMYPRSSRGHPVPSPATICPTRGRWNRDRDDLAAERSHFHLGTKSDEITALRATTLARRVRNRA
jgi:hypothetical protein